MGDGARQVVENSDASVAIMAEDVRRGDAIFGDGLRNRVVTEGVVDNHGVVTQTVTFEAIGTINNNALAVWNLENDQDISANGTFHFNNFGTFRKSSGLGESAFLGNTNRRFNHREGTVEVVSGKLTLAGSGNAQNDGNSTGAAFIVGADSVLDLNNDQRLFYSGEYTGTGTGRIELNGGELDSRSDSGVRFNFPDGMLHWIGGTIRTDTTGGDQFVNDGFMTLSGDAEKVFSGQEYHNRGTMIVSDAGDLKVSFSFLFNDEGALLDFRGDGSFVNGTLINDGVIRKSGGASTVIGSQLMQSAGSLLDVTTGELSLTKVDFASSTIQVATGAVVELADAENTGTFRMLEGTTLAGTGGGRVEFSGGRIDSLDSDARLNFAEGMFHWTGGAFRHDITNNGHITIDGDGGQLIQNLFTNRGTVVQTSGSVVSSWFGEFSNAIEGVWEMQGDSRMKGVSGLTSEPFYNFGTLRKTGIGTAIIEKGLSHHGGSIDVQAGTLSAGHIDNLQGTGGHFVVEAGAIFEITGDFGSSGTYTGGGGGQVKILAAIGGGGSKITTNFPEGLATLSVPNADDTHEVANVGWLTIDSDITTEMGSFRNTGTVIQAPGTHVQMRNYAIVVNHGTWELMDDASIVFHAFDRRGAYFSNFGILRKIGAPADASIGFGGGGSLPVFSNPGTIDVNSGTLTLNADTLKQFDEGNETLHGGTYRVASASTLQIADAEDNQPTITTNYASVSLDGASATFPNIDGLEVNGGSFNIANGRDFTTNGDLTNGVERAGIELKDVIPVTGGRFVGIAVDSASGRMITHARNQRIDNIPIFRVHDLNGVEIADPIAQPEPEVFGVNVSGIDIATSPLEVGGTSVPAGSLLFIHANSTPATLYAIDHHSDELLASVELPDAGIDQAGIALHPSRGTVFVVGKNEIVTEINPANGSTVGSFSARSSGASFFNINWGGVDVNADGNLLVVGSGQRRIRELTPTGEFVRDIDIAFAGMARESLSDISYDDATGEIWIASENGYVFRFSSITIGNFGTVRLRSDVSLEVNGNITLNPSSEVHIELSGHAWEGRTGKMEVGGAADIDGTLTISEDPTILYNDGERFEILSAAEEVSGTWQTDSDLFDIAYDTHAAVLFAGEVPNIDLATTEVVGPEIALAGDTATIEWTVRNLGVEPISGPWFDDIFVQRVFSSGPDTPLEFLQLGKRIFADEVRSGEGVTLQPGDSLNLSGAVKVPGIEEGVYRWAVNADSHAIVFETEGRTNNFRLSESPVVAFVPELVVDAVPTSGVFESVNEPLWYKFTVPALTDVSISVESDGPGVTELFLAQETLPTRYQFSVRHEQLGVADVTATAQGGAESSTWYATVVPTAIDSGPTTFSISATRLPAEITDVSPRTVGNSGKATLVIAGKRLRSDLRYELVDDDGNVIAPVEIAQRDSNRVYATFDASGLAVGEYQLRAVDDVVVTVVFEESIVVQPSHGPALELELLAPQIARAGIQRAIQLVYKNTGDSDMSLPFITISSEHGSLRPRRYTVAGARELTLIGEMPELGVTKIPPGHSGTTTLYYTPPLGNVIDELSFSAHTIDDPIFADTPFDWDAISAELQTDETDDDWDAYIESERQRVGETYEELHKLAISEYEYFASRGYFNIIYVNGDVLFDHPDVPSGGPIREALTFESATDPGVAEFPVTNLVGAPTDALFVGREAEGEDASGSSVRSLHAVVVGGGGNLDGAVNDAQAIGDFLETSINLPDSSSVQILTDSGRPGFWEGKVTPTKVVDAVDRAISRADSNDVIFVFNASHGSNPVTSGTCSVMQYGTGTRYAEREYFEDLGEFAVVRPRLDAQHRSLSPAILNDKFKQTDAQVIFVNDTCHSGEITRQIDADNVITIASSDYASVADSMTFGKELLKLWKANPSMLDLNDFRGAADANFFNVVQHSLKHGAQQQLIDTFIKEAYGSRDAASKYLRGKPIKEFNESLSAEGKYARKALLKKIGIVPPVAVIDDNGIGSLSIPIKKVKMPASKQIAEKIAVDRGVIGSGVAVSGLGKRSVDVRTSFDPNEKVVSAGIGELGFMRQGVALPYTVHFENDPDFATLPAQVVTITDILDDDLDLSTFELKAVSIGSEVLDIPQGLYAWSGEIPLVDQGNNVIAKVDVDLDFRTRALTWTFTTLDLETGKPTENALAGFLPVNDETGAGQGWVSYVVDPLPNATEGTEYRNFAKIVFDVNDPLITNETVNTVDDTAPVSQVEPLDARSAPQFAVAWSSDDGGGSGAESFDVYVSENDGEFTLWLDNTASSSATFTGTVGNTYAFYSVATDGVGHTEVDDGSPDTVTTVVVAPWTNPDDSYDVNGRDGPTALDALIVIIELGRRAVSDPVTQVLDDVAPGSFVPMFFDVSRDNKVTAIDALQVINEMARRDIAVEGETRAAVNGTDAGNDSTSSMTQAKLPEDLRQPRKIDSFGSQIASNIESPVTGVTQSPIVGPAADQVFQDWTPAERGIDWFGSLSLHESR